MTHSGRYRYVGPGDLRDLVLPVDAVAVEAPALLAGWFVRRDRAELGEPVTFVVTLDGLLQLASRRTEHVAVAAGQDVLAAGEMTFERVGVGWRVVEVTNQSTGYCPDLDSWQAVGRALDRLGVQHPGDFTNKVVFRRCPACGERNVVRDNDFICALCDCDLPGRWNFTST